MSITNDAAALDAKLESGELSLESLKIDEKQAAAELEAEEAATNSGKLKEEEEKTEAVLHDEAKMVNQRMGKNEMCAVHRVCAFIKHFIHRSN